MEGQPKLEQLGQEAKQESVKEIELARVLDEVRAKGLEAPGVRELVVRWKIEQEKKTASRDAIILNINIAQIYVAAGDRQGALESLEDARRQAFQEDESELTETIENMMAGIEM